MGKKDDILFDALMYGNVKDVQDGFFFKKLPHFYFEYGFSLLCYKLYPNKKHAKVMFYFPL